MIVVQLLYRSYLINAFAYVKRAGTVQPSLFLPKFPSFFLASSRKWRAFKTFVDTVRFLRQCIPTIYLSLKCGVYYPWQTFQLHLLHKGRSSAAVWRLACKTGPLLHKLKNAAEDTSQLGKLLGGIRLSGLRFFDGVLFLCKKSFYIFCARTSSSISFRALR